MIDIIKKNKLLQNNFVFLFISINSSKTQQQNILYEPIILSPKQ